jgi:transaldolase
MDNIKIFLDGPSIDNLITFNNDDQIQGFTFNPTLMRNAGVIDYGKFCQNICELTDKPVSFEVLADDFDEMKKEARILSDFGDNVYVKIPVMNSKGESSFRLIQDLSFEEIKINITAVFTADQVQIIEPMLNPDIPCIISVFAGRIMDVGLPAQPIVEEILWILERNKNVQILWASCREVYNIIQAANCGCDIITIPESIYNKLDLIGKNLEECSREAVTQFHLDALAADYRL